MKSSVQIQIVTWNSRQNLERLFLGIEQQEGVNYEVFVIDNGSRDGTPQIISNYQFPNSSKFPITNFQIIKNKENKGFAAAHNQGFAVCEAPYVLVLNPDTELQVGYLAEVVRVMESPPPSPLLGKGGGGRIAAVQGKLYRELPDHPLATSLAKEGELGGGIIDSCGLKLRSWGQVVDIGQNVAEKGEFEVTEVNRAPHPTLSQRERVLDTPHTPHPLDKLGAGPLPLPQGEGVREVWGVTGACALYRLETLKQVADKHGIFDERFGSYKEDADLAWRLQRAGWKAMFTPRAVAWHGRGVGKGDRRSWRIRWLSWRNQFLMLKKNLFRRKWKIENGR